MASVIDALFVSLGLKSDDFKKGTAETKTAMKSLRDESDRTGSHMENAAKTAVQGIQRLRNELLAVIGLLAAGNSLKSFFTGIVSGNAELGRMAHAFGMTAQALKAFEEVGERFGVSVQETDQLLGSFASSLGQMRELKQTSPLFETLQSQFAATGHSIRDTTGAVKSNQAVLLEYQQILRNTSESAALAMGAQVGMTANQVLELRSPDFEGQYNDALKNAPTDKAIADAQKLDRAWTAVTQKFHDLGSKILSEFMPAMTQAVTWLSEKFDEYGDQIKNGVIWGITEAKKVAIELYDYVRENWKQWLDQIVAIWLEIDHVVASMGGWKQVAIDLAAVWAGWKILEIVVSVLTLMGVVKDLMSLLGIGEVIAISALGGWIGTLLAAMYVLPRAMKLASDAFDKYMGWAAPSDHGVMTPQAAGDEASILKQLDEKSGLGPNGTAGLVGNIKAENDTFDPARKNAEGMVGLVQWNHTRAKQIEGHFGKAPENMTTTEQVDAIIWDLKTNYPQVYKAMQEAKTPEEAAIIFDHGFEIPRKEGESWEKYDTNRAVNAHGAAARRAARDGTAPPTNDDNRISTNPNPHSGTGSGRQQGHPVPSPSTLVPSTGHPASGGDQAMNNSSAVHIGAIHVHTSATDANGIAQSVRQAMNRRLFGYQAVSGLA